MGIFAAIYFRGLQNSTMQEKYRPTMCLFRYFRGDLCSRNYLSCEYRENKLVYSICFEQKLEKKFYYTNVGGEVGLNYMGVLYEFEPFARG